VQTAQRGDEAFISSNLVGRRLKRVNATRQKAIHYFVPCSQRRYAEYAEHLQQLQAEVERTKREAAIADALVGDDVAAKEAIRAVVLLLASSRGWADTTDGIHNITQSISAAIKAAANREAKQ
jgi:hypothetical protein